MAVRWALLLVGVLGLGWLLREVIGSPRAADGVTAVSPMLAVPEGGGGGAIVHLIRAVVAVVIAGAFGVLAAKLKTTRHALFVTGATLAWCALSCGDVAGAMRAGAGGAGGGGLWMLAIEGAVLGAVVVGVVYVISKMGGGAAAKRDRLDLPPAAHAGSPRAQHVEMTGAEIGFGVVLAMAAAFGGAWLVAATNLPGQTFAAAIVGAIAAGLVTSMLQKQGPAWVMVASVVVLGAIAPAIAAVMMKGQTESAFIEAWNAGKVIAPAKVLPLAWVAGALIGLPLGSMWGSSLVTAEKA